MSSPSPEYEAPRRSTRVRLEIPVVVVGIDAPTGFTELAKTLVVNPQGCGVRLKRALEPGTRIRLEKLPGGYPVNGRVANCLPIGSDGKFFLVGLALDESGNVWGLADPPADWDMPKDLATAASTGAASIKKSHEWPFSQFSSRGEFHPGRK